MWMSCSLSHSPVCSYPLYSRTLQYSPSYLMNYCNDFGMCIYFDVSLLQNHQFSVQNSQTTSKGYLLMYINSGLNHMKIRKSVLKNICFQTTKLVNWLKLSGRLAAFRWMHVSPAKHSYAGLPRKSDYRTDTDGQIDSGHPTKWSLHLYVPLCFTCDTINYV